MKRFRPNQKSRASKRKQKAKEAAFIETQKGALFNFFWREIKIYQELFTSNNVPRTPKQPSAVVY